jgi:hypothetical protein
MIPSTLQLQLLLQLAGVKVNPSLTPYVLGPCAPGLPVKLQLPHSVAVWHPGHPGSRMARAASKPATTNDRPGMIRLFWFIVILLKKVKQFKPRTNSENTPFRPFFTGNRARNY